MLIQRSDFLIGLVLLTNFPSFLPEIFLLPKLNFTLKNVFILYLMVSEEMQGTEDA